MDVFFYGLFMDTDLLRAKGLHPARPRIGSVENTRLVIGTRATLVPERGERAYGVVISLPANEVHGLYADASLRAYRAEQVRVLLDDGLTHEAVCYNVAPADAGRRDPVYASRLREVARRAGLPDAYVAKI